MAFWFISSYQQVCNLNVILFEVFFTCFEVENQKTVFFYVNAGSMLVVIYMYIYIYTAVFSFQFECAYWEIYSGIDHGGKYHVTYFCKPFPIIIVD